jgi:lysyl-tRNA synthetase class 2
VSSKRLSRLRAESVLAAAAALVGVIALVSALTPDFADRARFVRSVLPPGFPELARLLTFAFGIALLLVSRSLARRRRRAWMLALVAVVGVSISHLVKGLDFEEALVSLLLVVALLHYRTRFDVPGDPAVRRPVAGSILATAAAAGLGVALDTRGMLPDRLEELIGVAAVILALWALRLWLGPFPEHVRQSLEQRRRARELVESFGSDSLAFFALRRDKSYHFSSGGEAFLAYRLVGNSALVSGDPVGEETEIEPLLREFVAYARERGWRVAVVGASRGRLRLYRVLGIGRAIKLGEEAVVRPELFSTEGRSIRKVRQAARKVAERDGVSFRVVEAESADEKLRASLEEISTAWLAGRPERGFSMAMDDLFAPGGMLALALDRGSKPIAFLHLVPSPAGGGYSLSSQRRMPGSPGGISEYLIVETIGWAREADVREVSLNFCAFRSILHVDSSGRLTHRLARLALLRLDSFFQIERLHSFSRKFRPEWRPRYICLERLGDLPAVTLAYLRAESLIVRPRLPGRRRSAGLGDRPV